MAQNIIQPKNLLKNLYEGLNAFYTFYVCISHTNSTGDGQRNVQKQWNTTDVHNSLQSWQSPWHFR